MSICVFRYERIYNIVVVIHTEDEDRSLQYYVAQRHRLDTIILIATALCNVSVCLYAYFHTSRNAALRI